MLAWAGRSCFVQVNQPISFYQLHLPLIRNNTALQREKNDNDEKISDQLKEIAALTAIDTSNKNALRLIK